MNYVYIAKPIWVKIFFGRPAPCPALLPDKRAFSHIKIIRESSANAVLVSKKICDSSRFSLLGAVQK